MHNQRGKRQRLKIRFPCQCPPLSLFPVNVEHLQLRDLMEDIVFV